MRGLAGIPFGSWFPAARRSGDELSSARSMASRFALIIVIFAAIQAVILGLCLVTIEGINATRAYVAGEDTYTKAQKRAALDLRRYVVWGRPGDLEHFRREIAVPIGDRIGREALEARPPDLAKAFDGFRQAGNDARDIPSQSRLFVWFAWWGPFARAVDDWRTGDRMIAELAALADKVAAARAQAALGAARRDAFLDEINGLDERLTHFEDDFSAHMGDAARAARSLAMLGLMLSSALLWAIGIRLAWRTLRMAIFAERRLAHSEQRFRDFAKVASDWFWETDADSRLTYLGGRAGDPELAEPSPFIGKTLIELAEGNPADEIWQRHLESVAARRPFRDVSYSYRAPDGSEQFWSLSGAPVHDHRGQFQGYRGTGTDITHDVLVQRSLQQAKEQAETANRAKSEFLANMSHELRTPLNAILGFAEIIRERLLGPVADRYAEYANDIHSSGTHLLGIINDILDLSKVEAGRLELVEEIVDVQSIVRSVVLLLRERVGTAGLALKVELPDALLLLRADERKLKQVLMNLLSNAVKFTPAGGEILIRVHVEPHRGVVIEVRDSGIGIAPENIARALSPFGQVDSRLSRRYEGTGLGLPLARALAELHGGSLELASTPGQGTTVRIILPADRLVEREMRRWIAG
jgi:signal transduction histidine kinase